MARNRKDLAPIDHAAQRILNDLVEASGMSHRQIAEATDMSQNRVSTILRRDTPPATMGEIAAIAHAIGTSGAEVFLQAEAEVRESQDSVGGVRRISPSELGLAAKEDVRDVDWD